MRFELRPEMRLTLTPQMIQLLKLLQLPRLELEQTIREELEANPFLEQAEYDEDQPQTPERDDEELKWEEYLQDDVDPYYRPMRVDEEYLTRTPSRPPSLRDNLLIQLRINSNDPLELEIGEYLIDSLDENGYLCTPLEPIKEELKGKIPKERQKKGRPDIVESMLRLIQTFEPSGVGARDLKECLLLQIQERMGKGSVEANIVQEHLVDLEKKNYAKIARSLRVSERRVKKAAEVISSLQPYPGRIYFSSETRYITPDIVIDEKDGEFISMLNETDFPHLRIARAYVDVLANPSRFSKQEKAFIRDKMHRAKLFIAGLEKRRRTILMIANFVKDYQREFLEKGIKSLKPMSMRLIAQEVGVHEATVSRAVRDKYMKTPVGVFSFKSFFSRGVEHELIDSCSAAIKQTIKELIEEEDSSKPLSDKKITDILLKDGYSVKRRTITKYRQQLGFLSARSRKAA